MPRRESPSTSRRDVNAARSPHVAAVRRFSRFYTRTIGVLDERLLGSELSLTEGRVLYELAQRPTATATELATDLALDPGYLSRILRRFERDRLIRRRRAEHDGRQSVVTLSAAGHKAFAGIDASSDREIAALLDPLPPERRERLVDAMRLIEDTLGSERPAPSPYVLRPPRPGDLGWVVQRHGALYAREYGWDETFEALVEQIVAEYVQRHDARRDRCWIAELDGEVVGSVFLVKASPEVGRLRLLLVEPRTRGLGIGGRLVDECVRFAREVGYRTLTLWTNSVLVAARHLYERAGFALVEEKPHRSFGHDLVGQTWELPL